MRLWPLSRKSYPKQFVPLVGHDTLFQASARRVVAPDFAAPIVLTNGDFRFIVTEQLLSVGIDPGAIIIEPEGRNTAPAVLAAALHVIAQDPDGILLVTPSDHDIPDADAFRRTVLLGLPALTQGRIVTFGITPTHPETGYGYLELSSTPTPDGPPVTLSRFVEKPDHIGAQAMLEAGNFLWNAGIFLFRAADMVSAFEENAPEVLEPVLAALENAKVDLGFLRLNAEAWARAPNISLDYAVMEKSTNLSVVPFGGSWSDLGGWDAVWKASGPDAMGVVTHGAATAHDCRQSLLRSEMDGLELVGIGLENVIVVAMNDAVLVADMSRAQDVKKAVEALKGKGAKQAVQLPKDHRPWGWFETLVLADRFHVKRIVVHPGASLSLQSHNHRAEHWIVVEGTAKVTVDETVKLLSENQSVYVPLGSVHRMENPGKVPMILIEVQTGTYLGEDDIVRYEDVYSRGQGAKG